MRARVAKEIKNGTRISKLATLFRERNYGRTTRKATLEEVILERAPSPGRMICRSFRQEKSAEAFPVGALLCGRTHARCFARPDLDGSGLFVPSKPQNYDGN